MSPRSCFALSLASILLMVSSTAWAHVGFVSPEEGEIVPAGETYTVSWEVLIPHDTEFWHLELSTDGGGTWEPIVQNLPLATTRYDWDVPATLACDHCMIMVIQDNASAADYSDLRELCVGETCGGGGGGGGGCAVAPVATADPGTRGALLLLLGMALVGWSRMRRRQG